MSSCRIVDLAGVTFDTVVFVTNRTTAIRCTADRLVVDFVDNLAANYLDRSRSSGYVLRRFWLRQAGLVAQYESSLLNKMQGAAAVSQLEYAESSLVAAIPHVYRTVGQAPSSRSVVFFGNLSYFPNDEAAQWVASSFAKALNDLDPTIEIRIVGRSPSKALRKLVDSSRSVRLTEDVADISAKISAAVSL